MALTVTVPPGFRDWILDNLQRGSEPAAMVQRLVERDFDPRVARGVIETFARAHAAGSPVPQGPVKLELQAPEYAYEKPRMAAGHVLRAADRDVRVLQRLQRPCVALLEGVFSDAECAQLIDLARPRLSPSTIVDGQSGARTVADRKSDGMFFRVGEDAFIARLDARLSALMNCPLENGEGLQVLRYGPGGEYPPHCDFLVPRNPWSTASIARSGQRVSTLIVYLNDVAAGGETVFPAVGLSVTPRRNNAVYFEYANSRLQVDVNSIHAGAPVVDGEKWIATKWMRSQRFVPA